MADREDVVARGDGECAVREKVVLDVDEEERGWHSRPVERRALSRSRGGGGGEEVGDGDGRRAAELLRVESVYVSPGSAC